MKKQKNKLGNEMFFQVAYGGVNVDCCLYYYDIIMGGSVTTL